MAEQARMLASALPPKQVADLLRGRRTANNFLPECPPVALIEQGIELARWAPNHKLTEPWRFYLLGSRSQHAIIELNAELVRQTRGVTQAQAKRKRWRAIPGWLLLTQQRVSDPLQTREDYAACCCALQNLMLYLASQGVASKWTTGAVTRQPEFYRLLAIDPQREDVVSLLWYGYPAGTAVTQRSCTVADILSRRD